MKKIILLIVVSALAVSVTRAQDFVPQPVTVEWGEGAFRLPTILRLYYSPETEPLAGYLERELRRMYRFDDFRKTANTKLPSDAKGIIQIYVDPASSLPAEGYWLNVSGKDILIAGRDYGGVFNGIQTLLQMLPDAPPFCSDCRSVEIPIPQVNITDYPRFSYRGMMLDVARTFVPKDDVKKYIDRLSRHKINKFHWHLADDEGWRVEIKGYPELAVAGGFRGGDSPIPPVYGSWESKYGGYYTQDDIREIVAYAAVRNVEIIPEIDLPGHSRAVARVYPEILCAGGGSHVATNGMDMRNVWCAAREENYAMLDGIVKELAALFPSHYIHIGGDEVEYGQWSACPDCRRMMERKGYADKKQLHHYFVTRMETILAKYGKTASVWNEAAAGGRLAKDTHVYGWESVKACRTVAEAGCKTVVMPSPYFYFDMKYTPAEPGMTWAGMVPTDKVYSFDFAREGFTSADMANVIGVEGALWHELGLANGPSYVDRQSYPRICALAEVGWTPQAQRSWSDFRGRMDRTHFARLSRMGIRYRTEPQPSPKPVYITPTVRVESSMQARKSNPYSILTEYRNGSMAKTTRGARCGDYFLFTFATPVDCGSMEIVTGYPDLPRGVFSAGYAEVRYEYANEFVRYGNLLAGRITINPATPVAAVRIVCTSQPIGDSYAVVQPLKITAR